MTPQETKKITEILAKLTEVKLPHNASVVKRDLAKLVLDFHETYVPEVDKGSIEIVEKVK